MSSNTVINTNIAAISSYNSLTGVGIKQTTASERLSSGKKINSAADDAAGLAISEKMRAQIKGLDMAAKNGEDAISLIQTAEGSMSEIENMVQRIRELTVQAASETNTTIDREKIADEITQLQEEITDIAGRTEFNTRVLATGKYASGSNNQGGHGSLFFQIGANASQRITLLVGTVTATGLGLKGEGATGLGDVGSIAGIVRGANKGASISAVLTVLDRAIEKISKERAKLGAKQNRLQYTINNLETSSENLSSAKSRIEDTDMAKEMMNFTSANVLQQAATSMLAQANQLPNNVIQLLG